MDLSVRTGERVNRRHFVDNLQNLLVHQRTKFASLTQHFVCTQHHIGFGHILPTRLHRRAVLTGTKILQKGLNEVTTDDATAGAQNAAGFHHQPNRSFRCQLRHIALCRVQLQHRLQNVHNGVVFVLHTTLHEMRNFVTRNVNQMTRITVIALEVFDQNLLQRGDISRVSLEQVTAHEHFMLLGAADVQQHTGDADHAQRMKPMRVLWVPHFRQGYPLWQEFFVCLGQFLQYGGHFRRGSAMDFRLCDHAGLLLVPQCTNR